MAVMGYGLDAEYQQLLSVLLYTPGPEIGCHPEPAAIQHLHPIDQSLLGEEFGQLARTFGHLGVQILWIDPAPLTADRDYLYNMMYCRDLFFMTPEGAVLARMANGTRREEVRYAERTLGRNGIPVLHAVSGQGRFEGADALWLGEGLVAVGVGNRTNREGFRQVREVLDGMGVECVPLPSHQTATQHLLGTVQIVDRDLALVRSGIADGSIVPFLEAHGFTVVPVPETDEVRRRQAMNLVTVSPRTVVMTAGCPETKQLYLDAGLTVAAEIEVSQLLNGAGGLACATGIVARGAGRCTAAR